MITFTLKAHCVVSATRGLSAGPMRTESDDIMQQCGIMGFVCLLVKQPFVADESQCDSETFTDEFNVFKFDSRYVSSRSLTSFLSDWCYSGSHGLNETLA